MSIQDMIINWRAFFDEDDEDEIEDLLEDISYEADQLDDKIDDATNNMHAALNALAVGNEEEVKRILELAIGTIVSVPQPPDSVIKTWWVGGRAKMRGEKVAP